MRDGTNTNESASRKDRRESAGCGRHNKRDNVILYKGERIDDLERNGYGIIQKEGTFCFGMDGVLLSGFVTVRKNETVVDLCSGSGIIPILLEAKTEGGHFSGIEIQKDMAKMAQRSVMMNHQEDRVSIICDDIRRISENKAGFDENSIDVVSSLLFAICLLLFAICLLLFVY